MFEKVQTKWLKSREKINWEIEKYCPESFQAANVSEHCMALITAYLLRLSSACSRHTKSTPLQTHTHAHTHHCRHAVIHMSAAHKSINIIRFCSTPATDHTDHWLPFPVSFIYNKLIFVGCLLSFLILLLHCCCCSSQRIGFTATIAATIPWVFTSTAEVFIIVAVC